MEDEESAAVQRRVRSATRVFSVLAVLTVVSAESWTLHLPFLVAMTIALGIAVFKGLLVAMHFMHLTAEGRLIYLLLALALTAASALLLLPAADLFLRG